MLRAFDPAGNEHVFQGAIDPFSAVTKGWLRMSHRELDERLSTPYRPFHSHERASEVIPYEIYQLDVELWPTSVVLPPGWRLSLTLRGSDWVYGSAPETRLSNFKNAMQGSGPFLHNDPSDRPSSVFSGRTSIHLGESTHPFYASRSSRQQELGPYRQSVLPLKVAERRSDEDQSRRLRSHRRSRCAPHCRPPHTRSGRR